MPDFPVLISLPTQSVAIRAMVGSGVAVLVTALLLRSGLRIPRVRSAAVLAPVIALVGAVAISWGDLLLPTIMAATDAENAVTFRLADRYVRLAPIAWPLLAIWLAIASARLSRRVLVMRRMRLVADAGASPRDVRVRRLARSTAARLRVPVPRVVVVEGCPGGALVVGVRRRPTIVIDAGVLTDLDDEELEGLLAHELAHVRRRDNLLAALVGVVRDLFFFVPGGRGVVRRLCAERELAADQLAIGITDRPGALASGLLKVIDRHRPVAACAAFAAPAAVVTRVERLVAATPTPGRARSVAETAAVAAVLTLAVATGVHLPAAVAGLTGEALAFVWAPTVQAPAQATEALAFDVYRRSAPYEPSFQATPTPPSNDGHEFSRAFLRGDRSVASRSIPASDILNIARLEKNRLKAWDATPVFSANEGFGFYLLSRRDLP